MSTRIYTTYNYELGTLWAKPSIELYTKTKATDNLKSGSLVAFLDFNSVFGRKRYWLTRRGWSWQRKNPKIRAKEDGDTTLTFLFWYSYFSWSLSVVSSEGVERQKQNEPAYGTVKKCLSSAQNSRSAFAFSNARSIGIVFEFNVITRLKVANAVNRV